MRHDIYNVEDCEVCGAERVVMCAECIGREVPEQIAGCVNAATERLQRDVDQMIVVLGMAATCIQAHAVKPVFDDEVWSERTVESLLRSIQSWTGDPGKATSPYCEALKRISATRETGSASE